MTASGDVAPSDTMTTLCQSLILERAESYSASGKAADVSIHVSKLPQPMIYCPAAGLVMYEPLAAQGVARMQWLEKLSSPKVLDSKPVVTKSKQPLKQQQRWRPTSPKPTPTFYQHQQERELSVRGGQYCLCSNAAGRRAASGVSPGVGTGQLASRNQSPQSAAAKSVKAGQLDTTQWGFQQVADGAQLTYGDQQHARRSRSPQSPTGFFIRGSSAGTAVAASCDSCSRYHHNNVTRFPLTGDASASGAAAGKIGRISDCAGGDHSSWRRRYSLGDDSPGGTSSHHVSDRLTLTQPYVFRWGGRINRRHNSLCEMHGTTGPSIAGASRASLSRTIAVDDHISTSTATATRQAAQEAEVTAAAAQLGARADKLLKLLTLRAPEQGRRERPAASRMQPSRQLDSLQSADELAYGLHDDPIGMQQSYLQL